MDYLIKEDLLFVTQFLGLTQEQFADEIGVPSETISRIVSGTISPSYEMLEKIHSYIYEKGIKLNEIKALAYQKKHQTVLFHGSKDSIVGDISLDHSREHVDFGVGFYMGDNYSQSLDFVSQIKKSGNVYILKVDLSNLRVLHLDISLKWMLLIALNRGWIDDYKNTQKCQELIKEFESYDVIVAPIADNRMFNTISDFVTSAISSEQAIHALSDLSLGNQIVFRTKKSLKHIEILEKLFVSQKERSECIVSKTQRIIDADTYIKKNYEKYVRQGLYIKEVFEDEKNDL